MKNSLWTACPWYNTVVLCSMTVAGQPFPTFCWFLVMPGPAEQNGHQLAIHSVSPGSSGATSWNFYRWLPSPPTPTVIPWPKGKNLKDNFFHVFEFTQFPDPVHSTSARAAVGCAAEIRTGTNSKGKGGIEYLTQYHHESLSWEIKPECSHLLLRF